MTSFAYDDLLAAINYAGVHPLLGEIGAGAGIEKNPHELALFIVHCPLEIKTVLEIGTGYKAGLTQFMVNVLRWQVTTVDIEPPLVKTAHLARQVIADSKLAVDLVRNEYDLVILDGGHTYDAISRDYFHYADMGRVVMIANIEGLRGCEGVARFWREIAYSKKGNIKKWYEAIVDTGSPKRQGLGIVLKDTGY